MPRIQAGRATALAAGLVDYDEFEQAKALGFELFAGPVLRQPAPGGRSARSRSARWARWSSLAALQGGSATIEELEQVIDRDVGLSVKLLRYINSAYIGMRGSITSIRQAVMMLGSRGVSRWALLVALTGGPSTPRELSVVGLTRARMCELLGSDRRDVAGEELFTVGLLSVADALLDVPLETIVEELPLADEVSRRAAPARRARRRDPRRGGQLRAGRLRRRQPPGRTAGASPAPTATRSAGRSRPCRR